MPAFTSIALGGLAAAGAISGAMGSKKSGSSESWVDAGSANANELAGQQGMMNAYGDLQNFTNLGPGAKDITNAYGAQTDLASMLKGLQDTGGMPTAEDISFGNNAAGRLFGGQRAQMNNAFADQLTMANRDAAAMGRDPNSAILRNKLAQSQLQQSSVLDAQQGAFGQQLAMQNPMNKLNFANQRATVLGGLATQAMQNRQAIAAMGEGIMTNERNFRLQTAHRYGTSTESSGGGLGGAISGALAGAGAGMSLMKGFGGLNLGGGGGGGGGGGSAQIDYGQGPSGNFFGLSGGGSPAPQGNYFNLGTLGQSPVMGAPRVASNNTPYSVTPMGTGATGGW